MPKNAIAGIKYTKAGMVCRKSMIGLTMLDTVVFLAAQMPSGMATSNARNADTMTREMVSMALSH